MTTQNGSQGFASSVPNEWKMALMIFFGCFGVEWRESVANSSELKWIQATDRIEDRIHIPIHFVRKPHLAWGGERHLLSQLYLPQTLGNSNPINSPVVIAVVVAVVVVDVCAICLSSCVCVCVSAVEFLTTIWYRMQPHTHSHAHTHTIVWWIHNFCCNFSPIVSHRFGSICKHSVKIQKKIQNSQHTQQQQQQQQKERFLFSLFFCLFAK